MKLAPDFNRVIATFHHEEPDRVPLVEALVAYEIQSQFLGRKVEDPDLRSQVEFWTEASYDSIPLTVGMMNQLTVAVTPGAMMPVPSTAVTFCSFGGWTKNMVEESFKTPFVENAGFSKLRLAAKSVMGSVGSLSVICSVARNPILSSVKSWEMDILICAQRP